MCFGEGIPTLQLHFPAKDVKHQDLSKTLTIVVRIVVLVHLYWSRFDQRASSARIGSARDVKSFEKLRQKQRVCVTINLSS